MAKEIRWTKEAIDSFQNIIFYLKEKWTEKEIEQFVIATENIIKYISNYPEMFRRTNKRNLREALVTSQNLLIYKVYKTHIDLITFWDTRQHPRKKKKYKNK
jgi:plasmid stabilization system protein ParE